MATYQQSSSEMADLCATCDNYHLDGTWPDGSADAECAARCDPERDADGNCSCDKYRPAMTDDFCEW
jgi:hypothetical protein